MRCFHVVHHFGLRSYLSSFIFLTFATGSFVHKADLELSTGTSLRPETPTEGDPKEASWAQTRLEFQHGAHERPEGSQQRRTQKGRPRQPPPLPGRRRTLGDALGPAGDCSCPQPPRRRLLGGQAPFTLPRHPTPSVSIPRH